MKILNSSERMLMDDIAVNNAVKAVNILTLPQLITFLKSMSQEYAWSANDLKKHLVNSNIDTEEVDNLGKVWDIAAQGLEKTANDIKQHWESL
jgi:hypothetical protein